MRPYARDTQGTAIYRHAPLCSGTHMIQDRMSACADVSALPCVYGCTRARSTVRDAKAKGQTDGWMEEGFD